MPLYGNPNLFMEWRGVKYTEVEGSPESNFFFDRGMITRRIYVAGEDIEDAIDAFMGETSLVTDNVTGLRIISRSVPHPMPGRAHMSVQGITNINPMAQTDVILRDEHGFPTGPRSNIVPVFKDGSIGSLNDGTGLAQYKMAELTLQYTKPTYRVKEDVFVAVTDELSEYFGYPHEGYALASGHKNTRYITKHIKPMGRMLKIPRGLVKKGPGKSVLEALAITENASNFEYTWHHVPEDGVPHKAWLEATNGVNDDWFDGRPPGTLLFAGEPEMRLEQNPLSPDFYYTIKYNFHSLMMLDSSTDPGTIYGHNYIRDLDKVTGKLIIVKISTDGVGATDDTLIFKPFDFRRLFAPDKVVI